MEAKGLKPFTEYNYQFTVCKSDNASPVGRTKTAPAENAKLDELKLAVFSCSNYRKIILILSLKLSSNANLQFS